MNFSETFIRRPVLTLVVSTLILLLGIQVFMGMNIREYPEVEESVITVTTVYPNDGQSAGNSAAQSVIYLPPNTPSFSMSDGVSWGLNSG